MTISTPEKKKVFITGATSDMMQKLMGLIDTDRFEIFALSRNSDARFSGKVNLIHGNLEDISGHEQLIQQCELIIHAAAITHSFRVKPYYQINYDGTKTLVDLCDKQNSRFVFISSRVAGKKSGAYGHSKILAEDYIRKTCQHWLILRPAEVFGIGKKEGIEKLIIDACSKTILPYPAGVRSKMFPIHVCDAVEAIYSEIFNPEKKNKVITIRGEEGFTYRQVAELATQLCENRPRFIPIPKPIMMIASALMKWLSISRSITPDQIPRLYSKKENGTASKQTITLANYIEEKFSPEN